MGMGVFEVFFLIDFPHFSYIFIHFRSFFIHFSSIFAHFSSIFHPFSSIFALFPYKKFCEPHFKFCELHFSYFKTIFVVVFPQVLLSIELPAIVSPGSGRVAVTDLFERVVGADHRLKMSPARLGGSGWVAVD
jgi:hypothetical protein